MEVQLPFCIADNQERTEEEPSPATTSQDADYSSAFTVMGVTGLSTGSIGLALIHYGALSGIAASCLWCLSLGLLVSGTAALLYSGAHRYGLFPSSAQTHSELDQPPPRTSLHYAAGASSR